MAVGSWESRRTMHRWQPIGQPTTGISLLGRLGLWFVVQVVESSIRLPACGHMGKV